MHDCTVRQKNFGWKRGAAVEQMSEVGVHADDEDAAQDPESRHVPLAVSFTTN